MLRNTNPNYGKNLNKKPTFGYNKKRFKENTQKITPPIFVALDSCVFIHYERLKTNRANTAKEIEYKKCLKYLFEASKINKGEIGNGRFILVLLPGVKEELLNYQGEYLNFMQNLLASKTLTLEIDDKYKKWFEEKTKKLMDAYKKAGLFLDTNGELRNDARHVAESSIFNLTFISKDLDILAEKSERIKSINKRYLQSDFNGEQAFPRRLTNFFNSLSKGKKPPKPENLDISTTKTKLALNKINNLKTPQIHTLSFEFDNLFTNNSPEFVK